MNKANPLGLMAGVVFALSTACAADNNEQWRRLDFDADLTSYLVNVKQLSRTGDTGTVWELNVPGRTSLSVGAQNHMLVERIFDCRNGTQRIGQVLLYAKLGAKAKPLSHEDISYKVQPNSIDETEMKMACDNFQPEPTVYNEVVYGSTQEAVTKAFGDAIKLPREQSNKTLRGLGGMGPPPSGNTGPNNPGSAPSRPAP